MATKGRITSSDSAPAGRVLAIDYGRRRIGLAISDELGVTARPLETLERKNRDADLRRLRGIVREHSVRRIVVGNPVHLDGTASEMAEEAARFARRVERQLGLPVELVDERLSSWEAEQIARQKYPTKRASSTDHVAAAVILRDYLERTRAAKPRGGARG
jgi:putative Holliday junction resolvase